MTGLRDLVSRLVGKQRERQAAKELEFERLVRSLAEGKDVADDEVERILSDAGQAATDLQAAVELLLRRRGWAEQLDRREPLLREVKALERRREENNASLTAARDRAFKEDEEIRERVAQLERELANIEAAHFQLISTAGTRERHRQIGNESVALAMQLEDAQQQLRKDRAAFAAAERATSGPLSARPANLPEIIASTKHRVALSEQRVERAEDAYREVRGQAGELAAADLIP
jgi:hypothetical protein